MILIYFIFKAFNKQAQTTEKISAKDLIGKKLTEIFPTVKDFGLFDMLMRVEKTGEREIVETEFYQDGLIAVFYSEKELLEKGLKLEKQLTKTKKELEHQKNVFQHIMENSESISIQGYNQNHEVIYWNKGSEHLYGCTKEEAFGQKLEELIIPSFMQDAVREGVDNWIHKDIAIPSSEI